jgi:hypothetical protein
MSIWATCSSTISIALAVTFLISGATKARSAGTLEAVLMRLLPHAVWSIPLLNSRRLSRAVSTCEVLLATALLLTSGVAAQFAAAATVVLSGIFIGATITATRRGAPCGCAGSISARASWSDVARAVFVAVLTMLLLICRAHEQAWVWQGERRQLIVSLVAGLMVSAALLIWLYAGRPSRGVWSRRRIIRFPGITPARRGARYHPKMTLRQSLPDVAIISRRTALMRGGLALTGLFVALTLRGNTVAAGEEVSLAADPCWVCALLHQSCVEACASQYATCVRNVKSASDMLNCNTQLDDCRDACDQSEESCLESCGKC